MPSNPNSADNTENQIKLPESLKKVKQSQIMRKQQFLKDSENLLIHNQSYLIME